MNASSIYNLITKNLKPNDEGMFRYFNLAANYDVTLNFIEAGSKISNPTHDQTVFNYVLEGNFAVEMNNEHKVLKKGDWIQIPANTEHSVDAQTSVILLELWGK